MALKKEVMTKFGIPADYWRVGMVTVDRPMGEAAIGLNLYINETAEEFIESRVVSLRGQEGLSLFEKYFGTGADHFSDVYEASYLCVKEADDFFSDATDC